MDKKYFPIQKVDFLFPIYHYYNIGKNNRVLFDFRKEKNHMSITFLIIFWTANFFLSRCLSYALLSGYQYANGLLLGVPIPNEHLIDGDVVHLTNTCKNSMQNFLGLNTVVCIFGYLFIVFLSMIFFVLLYILWIFLYCVYGYCLFYSHHDKMYALARKHGWMPEKEDDNA